MKKSYIAVALAIAAAIGLYAFNKQHKTAAPATQNVKEEVTKVTLAHQNGWGYLPLYVMKEKKLIEKHAKELGHKDLIAEFINLGSPGVIRDAMLSGQVQFGAVGVPTLIVMADKTDGDLKAAGNIVSLPMFLNTLEDVNSICDLKGKIALPTIKTSVQAVTFQMAAEQKCGKLMDDQTVSTTHPDGMQTLLAQLDKPVTQGNISSHFTSPPFQYIELEKGKGKVKKLLDSYDVLGGPTSFILLVGFEKFKKSNPVAYKAVVAAFEDALKWIRENKKEAAELYIKSENPKGETAEEVLKQISGKDIIFDSTPNKIETYSKFMKKTGAVKSDFNWKDLSMDNLHDKKGS